MDQQACSFQAGRLTASTYVHTEYLLALVPTGTRRPWQTFARSTLVSCLRRFPHGPHDQYHTSTPEETKGTWIPPVLSPRFGRGSCTWWNEFCSVLGEFLLVYVFSIYVPVLFIHPSSYLYLSPCFPSSGSQHASSTCSAVPLIAAASQRRIPPNPRNTGYRLLTYLSNPQYFLAFVQTATLLREHWPPLLITLHNPTTYHNYPRAGPLPLICYLRGPTRFDYNDL